MSFFEDGKSTWYMHDEADRNFFNLRWKFFECLFEVGITKIRDTNDTLNFTIMAHNIVCVIHYIGFVF